jgi:hypothetical protein
MTMRLQSPNRSSAHLRRALAGALSAGLLASGGLGCADSAKAARGMEVAVQDDPVFTSQSYFDRARAFRLARNVGVTRLRVNVNWAYSMSPKAARARTKPAGLVYQWGAIDSAIDAAAANGIRVHLSLTGPAPAWATSNRKIGPMRPSASEFGRFASLAALHFRGRVDRYSIWNEPNWKGWLSPLGSGPAIYRQLYTRGYAAIKRADPRALVLIGETAPYNRTGFSTSPVAFLRALTCVNKGYRHTRSCPRLKADGYAHHPYDFAHSPRYRHPGADNATMGTLSNLTRALDRLSRAGVLRYTRGGRMPLYLTEFGYFGSGPRKLPSAKAARYLKDGFQMALRNPRVKSQLQYLLVSPPKSKPYSYFDLALLTTGGGKRSTYNALRSFYVKNRSVLRRVRGPLALPAAPPS